MVKPKIKHQQRLLRQKERIKFNKKHPKPKVQHKRNYINENNQQITERVNYPFGRRGRRSKPNG